MRSCLRRVERAKPLLGTFVRIALCDVETRASHQLIDRCFSEVAEIHRLMSFQDPDSDVSRLNRDAHLHPVRVDARTYEVLSLASRVSARTGGIFDITIAPQAVSALAAAAPPNAPHPSSDARWSDIVLLPDCAVRFRCPLWIDVSGIAKGYAVDQVIELLSGASVTQACVNAGGDLRVMGPRSEWVGIHADGDMSTAPLTELCNESLATSGHRHCAGAGSCSVAHFDGSDRGKTPVRFVSVLAATCGIADALTKVVMARGAGASGALRSFGARALMSDDLSGWREVA